MVSLWPGTSAISREDFAFKFDHVSLKSLGLTNRTLNALLSYNFKMTVGDVILADESFMSVKGLGRAGIEELTKKISQLLAETQNSKSQLSTDQSTTLTNLEQAVSPMPSRKLCTDDQQANKQRSVPIDMSAQQTQQGRPLRVSV